MEPAGGAGSMPPQPMSYEQFQEMRRRREEQEQAMAREALLRAGADRHSERLRALLAELQGLLEEIARADNQVRVQMDAQLRQLKAIEDRVRQAESAIQAILAEPQVIRH
jgi:hypothetical protein